MMERDIYGVRQPDDRKPLTRFEDSLSFFLLVITAGFIGIVVWLYIPKVEHFIHDPDTGTTYRQWSYGTLDVIGSDPARSQE